MDSSGQQRPRPRRRRPVLWTICLALEIFAVAVTVFALISGEARHVWQAVAVIGVGTLGAAMSVYELVRRR